MPVPVVVRLALFAVLIGCGAAAAQNMKPAGMSQSEAASRRFPQPVRVGDLIGRTVLQPLESQPILGRVRQLVRSPDNSTVVIMSHGGFLGIGTRSIGVPLEAMVALGEHVEVVDLTPEQLDASPIFDAAGTTALGPDDVVKIGLARPSH